MPFCLALFIEHHVLSQPDTPVALGLTCKAANALMKQTMHVQRWLKVEPTYLEQVEFVNQLRHKGKPDTLCFTTSYDRWRFSHKAESNTVAFSLLENRCISMVASVKRYWDFRGVVSVEVCNALPLLPVRGHQGKKERVMWRKWHFYYTYNPRYTMRSNRKHMNKLLHLVAKIHAKRCINYQMTRYACELIDRTAANATKLRERVFAIQRTMLAVTGVMVVGIWILF